MDNSTFEKYITEFYNINPDDLENEYIKVVKAFYTFSELTSDSYADQIIAKDEVKRISAQEYLQAKKDGATDKTATATAECSDRVTTAKSTYHANLRSWEKNKGHKETTMLKKEMLVSLGFSRKDDLNVTEQS